jgi:hypothetical protein
MVTLDTTWRWVAMLLVAGGVGLIGGVAAALLETKGNFNAKPPNKGAWLLNGITCVFVGGVAAVAVIYFFVPVKEVIPKGGGKPEAFYELIKLVPLSLIVGSAGTYFLRSFQQRIKDAVAAQEGNQEADKTRKLAGVAEGLPEQTDQSLESAGANFQTILQSAGVDPGKAEEVAPQLVEEAKKAAAEVLQPQIDTIQSIAAPLARHNPDG